MRTISVGTQVWWREIVIHLPSCALATTAQCAHCTPPLETSFLPFLTLPRDCSAIHHPIRSCSTPTPYMPCPSLILHETQNMTEKTLRTTSSTWLPSPGRKPKTSPTGTSELRRPKRRLPVRPGPRRRPWPRRDSTVASSSIPVRGR